MAKDVSPRHATRKDVADLAGVSTAVVSYVVNDGPRHVAPATKQRVLDAIEQLGYRPNASARALKIGSNGTYGMLVTSVTNMFHATVIEAVDKQMSASGFSMLLAHGDVDLNRNHTIYNNMVNRGVEGLVIMMSGIDDDEWLAKKTQFPVVLLDRAHPLFGHVTIGVDYLEGGRLATEHLVQHGRRRIVPILGPQVERGGGNLRLRGYMKAMAAGDLEVIEPVTTSWTAEGGYAAAVQVLEEHPDVDGLFCFSDMLAVGAMQALQDRGVRIPQDVAVVSFDGSPASRFSSPALTSVAQPIDDMAAYAVKALSEPRPDGFEHKAFPVNLIVRETCGCTRDLDDRG